eukprot:GHVS01090543.1.p1 GENE.GHVS01090543.1~~GHVS01090543.1.p1  ORF type:complete len:428 (+),score=121.19 GHVS01090543.1:323-1606(+)
MSSTISLGLTSSLADYAVALRTSRGTTYNKMNNKQQQQRTSSASSKALKNNTTTISAKTAAGSPVPPQTTNKQQQHDSTAPVDIHKYLSSSLDDLVKQQQHQRKGRAVGKQAASRGGGRRSVQQHAAGVTPGRVWVVGSRGSRGGGSRGGRPGLRRGVSGVSWTGVVGRGGVTSYTYSPATRGGGGIFSPPPTRGWFGFRGRGRAFGGSRGGDGLFMASGGGKSVDVFSRGIAKQQQARVGGGRYRTPTTRPGNMRGGVGGSVWDSVGGYDGPAGSPYLYDSSGGYDSEWVDGGDDNTVDVVDTDMVIEGGAQTTGTNAYNNCHTMRTKQGVSGGTDYVVSSSGVMNDGMGGGIWNTGSGGVVSGVGRRRTLRDEDKEMMTKIKIVAALDKIPPALTVQKKSHDSSSVGGGRPGAHKTLSDRFASNK